MITESLTSPVHKVISQHEVAEVWLNTSTNQQSLHSLKAFNPGDSIADFGPSALHSQPSYLTVQVGINRHIILNPEFLQYINHSCSPNVFFDTTAMQLVCLKPIAAGEEMRFFYPSTEWDMAQPFVCNCGSSECLQLINGASHLSLETLSRYRISNFISEQLKEKV